MTSAKNPASIENITDNLFLITLPMPFRLRPVNIAALVDGKRVTLFDTGLNLGDTFPRVEDALKEIGRSVRDVEDIFITHYHADHCGLAGKIKELSGAVIHMSEVSKQVRDDNHDQNTVADTVKKFYTKQGIPEDRVDSYLIFLRYSRRATVPFQIDEFLDFGREYRVGSTTVEVLPSPGHARDHVCYFFRNEGILLSGDHLLPESQFNLRPDLFCPEFHSAQSMLDSLTRIEELPVARVLPGHGVPFANAHRVIERITRTHEGRRDSVLRSLRKGAKTAFQVSREIFGSDLPGFDTFLSLNETYAHLVELRHGGMVKESEGNGRVLYGIEDTQYYTTFHDAARCI
jgi:glyoxylase-like metal-dependent hydrolase (beta-lactamase superfamily II)